MTTQIAGTGTLLGLLQRGRGKGHVDALNAERADAASALTHCITNDPRMDDQVEDRADYYGRCATAVDLNVSAIEEYLFSPANRGDENGGIALATGTLACMGRLGRADAIDIVRRYIERGPHWETALDELAYPMPIGVADLDQVVISRCATLDDLALAVPHPKPHEPWITWREKNPRIRQAFKRREELRREQDERNRELSALSTEELLRRREGRLLRQRTTEADKRVLLAAAVGDDERLRHTALKVLGWQRDPAVFEPAEAELRRYADREWPPNAGWMALFKLIDSGPIPRVRAWIGEEGRPGAFALHMVSRWPETADAPLLRSALGHFRDESWLYQVCDAVEGLAKLADAGAVPALERIYAETTYSYLRKKAARVLAITSSGFADGFGIECLWDCEEETRAVGCAVASLTTLDVRQRLHELAADRLEGKRVRALAARRSRALA